MKKSFSGLLALAGLFNLTPVGATEIGRVDAVQESAWLQRDTNRIALAPGVPLQGGDTLVTDPGGRVAIDMQSDVTLVLNAASELRLLEAGDGDSEQAVISLRRGDACIDYNPQQDKGVAYVIDIGSMLTAALRHEGRICARREAELTRLSLRAGSVQLRHAVDPSTIVISEAGTEIRIDDEGEFVLLTTGVDEELTEFDESEPASQSAADGTTPPQPVSGQSAAADESVQSAESTTPANLQPVDESDSAMPPIDGQSADSASTVNQETTAASDEDTPSAPAGSGVSAYSYTVYLFSTRSQQVADDVNQRFHDAGHKTRIIVNESEAVTRYRVAMPGFGNRAEAQAFAGAMVGKHGIGSTWIGRQRRDAEQNDEASAAAN